MVYSIIIIIIIILVLCAGYKIIDKQIKEAHIKKDSKISFRAGMDLTNFPIVTFTSKGTKLNFLLDTGSNVSCIDSCMLDYIEHEDLNQTTDTNGLDGIVEKGTALHVARIGYNSQEFIEIFCIRDMSKAFTIIKNESGVQLHGILGSDFFEKYKYVLDFKKLEAYKK